MRSCWRHVPGPEQSTRAHASQKISLADRPGQPGPDRLVLVQPLMDQPKLEHQTSQNKDQPADPDTSQSDQPLIDTPANEQSSSRSWQPDDQHAGNDQDQQTSWKSSYTADELGRQARDAVGSSRKSSRTARLADQLDRGRMSQKTCFQTSRTRTGRSARGSAGRAPPSPPWRRQRRSRS